MGISSQQSKAVNRCGCVVGCVCRMSVSSECTSNAILDLFVPISDSYSSLMTWFGNAKTRREHGHKAKSSPTNMRPGQFPILVPVVLLLSGLCILNQEVSSIGHLQEEASGALKGNFMVGGGEIGVDDDDYELPIDEQIPVATNEYRMGIPGSPQYDPEAPTIVVQLGGNTFNNIAHVARGMGLSLWMEREYGVKASLVLKRQKVAVAREAERDVKQCFPFMRSFDFGAATTPEMEQAIEQQRSDPIMKEVERVTNLVNNRTIPLLKKKLPVFLETYNKRHPRTEKHNRIGQVNLPFIYAWRLTCSGPLMDKYYDDFRNIFQFDHDNNDCCSGGPAADETVFVSA